jgi:acyl carrier protein
MAVVIDRGRILEIVANAFALEDLDMARITDNTNFEEDLGMDELDMIELVSDLESEFHINIYDKDAEKFTTVKAVLEYLEKVLNRRAKIVDIVVAVLGLDDVEAKSLKDDTNLAMKYEMGDDERAELRSALESKFHAVIPAGDARKFTTIAAILEYLNDNLMEDQHER